MPDGTLVIPVAADYIPWTSLLSQRAQEFLTLVKTDSSIKGIRVVTDGRFSPLAEQELSRLGVSVTGQFLGLRQLGKPTN